MNKLFGGKFVASGSNTCIINPNIKCANNKFKKRDKKSISKIAFGDKAKEYGEREKNINDTIKRIPKYKDWALIFDQICKPPPFKESILIDKDINKCLNDEETLPLHSGIESKKKELFNYNSIMLIGEFGGITLSDYFNKHFDKFNESKNIKLLEKEFLKLMKKMKNLFQGLVELNKYKIIHLDIKQNNIVIKGDFKFIDFGLSNILSNKEHFLTRSYNEFKSSRLYIWYPPEYIYFNISNDEIKLELDKINVEGIDEFRRHINMNNDIYEFFNINFEKEIISLLKNYKSLDYKKFMKHEYENLINGVDTYSFGILIPLLFYMNDILDLVKKSEILSDFFNLFKKMCEPFYKTRIHITDAYDIFIGLLEKYNANNSKKSKKQSKKSKKVKKKSMKGKGKGKYRTSRKRRKHSRKKSRKKSRNK